MTLNRGEVVEMQQAVFDPSGKWLATLDPLGVALWPVARAYPRVLSGHTERVSAVAFLPDGTAIISASADGTVRLWPLGDGAGRAEGVLFADETAKWIDVAVSDDGRYVLVAGQDGRVMVVPMFGGQSRVLEGFSGQVYAVAFGPGGRLAAAGGGQYDATEAVVRVWDLQTGAVCVLDPGDGAFISDLRVLPDGRVISAGLGGVHSWRATDDSHELLFDRPSCCLAGDASGRRLVAVTLENEWYELALGGDAPRRLPLDLGPRQGPAALNPAGTLAVMGRFDGTLRLGPPDDPSAWHLAFGHRGLILDVAFHPDEPWVATAGADRTVRLWPEPAGAPFHRLARETILGRLQQMTNLRVLPDADTPGGYRLDTIQFSGWSDPADW